MKLLFLVGSMVCVVSALHGQFVTINPEGQFVCDDKPYNFIGTNLWYGMNLGAEGNQDGRQRLLRELDQLQALGIDNLRVMGSSEGDGDYQIVSTLQPSPGVYRENIFRGLDFLLSEMAKRDMKAVVVLNNFWMWSGGMPQYVSWEEGSEVPYPDIENGSSWDPFISYSLRFYTNKKSQRPFREFVKNILTRVNIYTGKMYRDDPAIMAWQLCNEPRGYDQQKDYRHWIKSTSRLIKRLDKNHLLSLGAEGNADTSEAGIDLAADNDVAEIDYATVHVWIQNWGWYDPKDTTTFSESLELAKDYLKNQLDKAKSIRKPIVIEEFGVSRDNGRYDPQSTAIYRDRFYQFIFEYTLEEISSGGSVQGCNFWSWSGEGRPDNPGEIWEPGTPLIGDPPHERQGWYSVYNCDETTLNLIKQYQTKLDNILALKAKANSTKKP